MVNHTNAEPENDVLKTEEVRQEQANISEQRGENQQNSYGSRKAGKSKREIMKDLSRARSPWDE